MKTITSIVFLMLLIFTEKSIAQDTTFTSGVFLTVKDYQNNKLIQEADCDNNKEKFKTNALISKSTFDVIYKGLKTTYQKNDIYAYRDCEHNVWRFYNNKEYKIMESKSIYVYSMRKVAMDGGVIEKKSVYYFSSSASGDIKELTIDNLKLTYPNNHVFNNMLDEEFVEDKPVHSYDFVHEMYKVNYLFIQSKK
jgi:hypothetical protein